MKHSMKKKHADPVRPLFVPLGQGARENIEAIEKKKRHKGAGLDSSIVGPPGRRHRTKKSSAHRCVVCLSFSFSFRLGEKKKSHKETPNRIVRNIQGTKGDLFYDDGDDDDSKEKGSRTDVNKIENRKKKKKSGRKERQNGEKKKEASHGRGDRTVRVGMLGAENQESRGRDDADVAAVPSRAPALGLGTEERSALWGRGSSKG